MQTVQNALLFEVPYWGILGPFREANRSKRPSSSKFPIRAFWGLFSKQTVQNPLLLRSSLLGHFGAFSRSKPFKTPFLFEAPYWGLFAKQTVQNALRLRSSLLGPFGALPLRSCWGILGPFRETNRSKRPSSSKLLGHFGAFSQCKPFKTPFLFEVPHWGILGPFRGGSRSKRPSSSKFPIGALGGLFAKQTVQNDLPLRSSLLGHFGAFSRSKPFKMPFLFEVPHWGILGPFRNASHSKRLSSSKFPIGAFWSLFAKQTVQNALLLRSSLSGPWGAFSRSKPFKTTFLFEVPYWGILEPFREANRSKCPSSSKFPIGAFWGLFAKHTVQNALPLRSYLLGHFGAFSRNKPFKTPFLFEVLYWGLLGAFSRSKPFKTPFLFEVPYWGILGPFRGANRSKCPSSSKFPIGAFRCLFAEHSETPFLFEVHYWGIFGPSREANRSKRPSSSKFPIGAFWGLFAKQTVQNALPLRSCLLGHFGTFSRSDRSKRTSSSKFPIEHFGAFSRSKPFKTTFLVLGLFAKQTVQNALRSLV